MARIDVDLVRIDVGTAECDPSPTRTRSRSPWSTIAVLMVLAGLAACGGDAEPEGSAQSPDGAADAGPARQESRRDMLGSAIARGPAWVPGRPLYTRAQAASGEELFLEHCTACHGLDGMTSPQLHDNWMGRTVADFYEYLQYAMPYDAPGRLSPEQNADLTAFLFRENGLPAGPEPFDPDAEILTELRLAHPDSASPRESSNSP